MTTIRWLAAGAALMAAAFIAGRLTARPKTVEVERVVTKQVEGKKSEARVTERVVNRNVDRWRTRTKYLAGHVIEVESSGSIARDRGVSKTVATGATETRIRTIAADRTITAPQTARDKWQLGVYVMGGLQKEARLGYGPVIGRRIGASPFWVSAQADVKNKAATVGISVTW